MPFRSAQDALSNINDISEGVVPELLKDFLESNLPKVRALILIQLVTSVQVKSKKKSKYQLGVGESKLAGNLSEALQFPCLTQDPVPEIVSQLVVTFTVVLTVI